jgi:uroporphyrinogen decarboxylase
MDSVFLNALNGQNQCGRPPVWLMRQAGRYMKAYQGLRSKHSFMQMIHTPELAAEITLQPVQAFGLDAAILFSDILVVPESLGMSLQFVDGKGPIFEKPIRTEADVCQLETAGHRDSLQFVTAAITAVKPALDVPLIGFAGSPVTVALYMIDGGSSPDHRNARLWLHQNPELAQRLFDLLTDQTISYLASQVAAGVDAIQIFESAGALLSPSEFRKWSLPCLIRIGDALSKLRIPSILFYRGAGPTFQALTQLPYQALSIDWSMPIEMAKQYRVDKHLQGNLDPVALLGPMSHLQSEVWHILSTMKGDPGFIFNLGHGVLPQTPEHRIKELVEWIHSDESR